MSAATSIVRRKIGPKLHNPARKNESLISEKQREIHRLYCDGETAVSLAARLGMSRHTIWEAIARVHRANKDERLAKYARGELP